MKKQKRSKLKRSQDKASLVKIRSQIKKHSKRKNRASSDKPFPRTVNLAIEKVKMQLVPISQRAINHPSLTRLRNLGRENEIVLVPKLQVSEVKNHLKG